MVEVVSGHRGPAPRKERVLEVAKSPFPVAPGEVEYQSSIANYRHQVTSPYDVHDPKTGRITPAKPKVAQFRDFTFRTKDEEVIGELDKAPDCGLGMLFWRAEKLEAAVVKAKDDAFRAYIAKDPEKARQMLKEIAAASDVTDLVKDKKSK